MKSTNFIVCEVSWPFFKLIPVSNDTYRWMTFVHEFELYKNTVFYNETLDNYSEDMTTKELIEE